MAGEGSWVNSWCWGGEWHESAAVFSHGMLLIYLLQLCLPFSHCFSTCCILLPSIRTAQPKKVGWRKNMGLRKTLASGSL